MNRHGARYVGQTTLLEPG